MIKVLNLTESRKMNTSASSKMINYLVWGQSQVRLGKSPPQSRRVASRRLEVALISLHQVLVFMHYVDRLDDSNHLGNLGSCRWYSGLVLSQGMHHSCLWFSAIFPMQYWDTANYLLFGLSFPASCTRWLKLWSCCNAMRSLESFGSTFPYSFTS